jgi:AAA domain
MGSELTPLLVKAGRSDEPMRLENSYTRQYQMSLFQRFWIAGCPSRIAFKETHRAEKSILDLYNRVCGSRLISSYSDKDAIVHSRSFLRKKLFNGRNIRRNYAFVNVTGDEYKPDKRSKANDSNVRATMSIYKALIEDGFRPKDISILSPFKSQNAQYLLAMQSLCLSDPTTFKDVYKTKISTLDKFQGDQSLIILLDLVATQELGFLADTKRMDVALSRARSLFIMIGNENVIKKFERRHSHVKEAIDVCKHFCTFVQASDCTICNNFDLNIEYAEGDELEMFEYS